MPNAWLIALKIYMEGWKMFFDPDWPKKKEK